VLIGVPAAGNEQRLVVLGGQHEATRAVHAAHTTLLCQRHGAPRLGQSQVII
jgi:hypothetical protein